ncbi:MAG: hypothetical protein NVSMB9_14380 [Isosphaeraceae bacterium]
MNLKSLSMLLIAVIFGLGAMYGTSKLLTRGRSAPVVEMEDVLVAARDLKVEETLKPELVKITRMAKSNVPMGAYRSAKDVEERWVSMALLENEPVIDRKLAPRGSPPGLIARIPQGMRAFAVEVNEQTGVSGFILPDHHVDVVQMEPGDNGKPVAATVLQDALVLASGQIFTRPDDRSIQTRTVTLAVTPEQVDVLVEARSRGTLSLSLRGLNDHVQAARAKRIPKTPPPEPKVELVALKPPVPTPPPTPPPPPPAPRARFVTVYRGMENVRKIRLDQPSELSLEEQANGESTGARATPSPDSSTN